MAERQSNPEQSASAGDAASSATPANGTRPLWLASTLAIGALALIFGWIYLRFASRLHFVLDDYIEAEAALARPLLAALRDSFSGALNWSGYRPVSYALRALLVHTFGIERLTGYYLVILLLHFANTLLVYHLVWRVGRRVSLAFLAAAFFLLLPAHNEAVLYFSASANLIALFFALVTLEFALSATRPTETAPKEPVTRWWAILAAALFYWLAILAYEVTLPLILLIILGDWWLTASGGRISFGVFLRKRLWLYVALAIAAFLALTMRALWGGGVLGAPRADYGASFAPAHLAYGYTMLLSQMALLFNSPWQHLPDFVYTREWMAWTNPRALVSVALTFVLSLVSLGLAWRTEAPLTKRKDALFWLAWGLLWLLLISLPFAALDGRNPENRYTYIPSFGAAILLAALFALLLDWIVRRGWQLIGAPLLIVLVSAALAFYAWVDTSDVAEWERAAAHAFSFVTAADSLPIEGNETIAQVGVPGDVGSAYLFTTAESFAAAMRLYGATLSSEIVAGDLALRATLEDGGFDPTVLLYDPNTHTTRVALSAGICGENPTPADCTWSPVAPPRDDPETPWYYVQVYNEQTPEKGGLGIIVALEPGETTLVNCWLFYDAENVTVDPSQFDNDAVRARCQDAFAALQTLPALIRTQP